MTLGGRDPGSVEESRPLVVVFACGDPLRGDDAAAPTAVAALPAGAAELADVRVVGALEVEYLVDVAPGVPVVVVDAVVGVRPGRIIEMDLADLPGAARSVVATSTHQLPLDRVVALAQLLRDEPLSGRFIGIGIESVAHGLAHSAAVEASLPELAHAVESAVMTAAQGSSGPTSSNR